jgi:hypothetical protein
MLVSYSRKSQRPVSSNVRLLSAPPYAVITLAKFECFPR